MTDSRVASLAALLQQAHVAWANLLKVPADGVTDATEAMQAAVDGERLWLAKWLIARGVTVGSRLGEPSPEPIDLLATAVGALADVDVVHLTETWTDREGCFYGGIPEWRASLLGHLRERFAALRPDGFGVRAGSEEAP
jgi:hypothetical protein